jgi:tetratricopeptide (TPR) repeat protein
VRAQIAILLSILSSAAADTIHLKSGGTIVADVVRQNGERVEYDIGDDTYAIPKAFVDHIDTGAGIPATSPSETDANITAPKLESAKPAEATPDSRMTTERLAQIEQTGDKEKLATALVALGLQEQRLGKDDDARAHMERALSLAPQDGEAAASYAWILLRQERAWLAETYAEDAARRIPESAFAHKVLALAYYKNDKIQQALAEFKRAKELNPSDQEVKYYLQTTARQVKAESDFRSDASTHFNMRYEGEKAPAKLREQILAVLERHFDDLVSTIGLLPRDPISVVLYTNQTYFDVTHAPSWTAALNDGKLRIPIEGLTGVTPDLSRVLKHELAHSFIRQATNGRCPVWLNEGLAQLVEPQSASRYRSLLAKLFQNGDQAPLHSLEGSFIGLDSSQAAVAYIESLAYVEYIRDSYGMNRISDIMRHLSEAETPEAALKSAINDDYSQLEEEFTRHLR